MLIKLTYAVAKFLYDSVGLQFTNETLLSLKSRGVQRTIEGFKDFRDKSVNSATIPARNFIKLIAQIFFFEGIAIILITKSTHPLVLQLPITSCLLIALSKVSITKEELKRYLTKTYGIVSYVIFYGCFVWIALRTSFLAARAKSGNSRIDLTPFFDQTLKEITSQPIDWYIWGSLIVAFPAFILMLAFLIGWLTSFLMQLVVRLSLKKSPIDPLKYITYIVGGLLIVDVIILLVNSL